MSQANKEDHDFNWVKARRECSVEAEFVHLRYSVEHSTSERQNGLKPDHKSLLKFQELNNLEFIVISTAFGMRTVLFTRQGNHIVVKKTIGEEEPEICELTLTLTDEGKCRFKIDGNGEYLRWQVARKSLEEIFFYGLFEKESQ